MTEQTFKIGDRVYAQEDERFGKVLRICDYGQTIHVELDAQPSRRWFGSSRLTPEAMPPVSLAEQADHIGDVNEMVSADEQTLEGTLIEKGMAYVAAYDGPGNATAALGALLEAGRALRLFRTPKAEEIPALLPCPFCAGVAEARSEYQSSDQPWTVECGSCCCEMTYSSKDAVVTRWNSRSPAKPLPIEQEPTDEAIMRFASQWRGGPHVDYVRTFLTRFSTPKAETPRLTDAEIEEIGRSINPAAYEQYQSTFHRFARALIAKVTQP